MPCRFFIRVCFCLSLGLSSYTWAETKQHFSPAHSFAGAWLAGHVAGNDNNTGLAIDYYRQALSFQPDNTLVQPELMVTLLAAGQFDEAAKLAAQLRGSTNVQRFARLILAAQSLRHQRYSQAITDIRHEEADIMDDLTASLVSAWATLGQGDKKQAIKELEALQGPDWYNIFRYYHLGLIHDLAGDKLQADTAFRKAMKDETGSASAPDTYERVIMGYTSYLMRNGQQKQAIDLLKQAETILSGRKALYELRRQIEQGKKPARLVSTPVEGAAEALHNIGTAINRAGGESYAYLYLQTAFAMQPHKDAILYQLADSAAKAGNPQQAILFYQQVGEGSPYFRDSAVRLALNLADTGAQDKAINRLDKLIARYPEDIQLSSVLASLYMQLFDYAKASAVLDRVLDRPEQKKSKNWNLFFQRGIAYERQSKWDKAEADFRQALFFFPNEPQVLNYLGYSLIDRNMKLDEALDMVRQAVSLRPQDSYIVDSLGWAYYKLGRYEDAANILEKAVKLRPQDATINDHLGDAYWRAGRKLEATFQWNHAIANNPEPDELAKIRQKLEHGLQDEKTLTGKAGQGG